MTWGRGVAGVWGSWRRPRRGVLVPEVEGTGLPLTELLPYTKSETRQIKKTTTTFYTEKEIERRGKRQSQRWRSKEKSEREQETTITTMATIRRVEQPVM